MFNRKKFAIFLVGIIGIVSLMACQKPNAQQSNVIDTEGTQKTVLEMEMDANYSSSDSFENGLPILCDRGYGSLRRRGLFSDGW